MSTLKGILSGFLFLLIFNLSCKKAPDQPPITLKPEDFQNVSYGANPRNILDVYLPETRDDKTPLILLLHGGSWFEGDKSAFADLAKYWRDKGYAAATMNYRLTNTAEKNVHPSQVNDIAKAIEFIGSKCKEWEISSDKFALQGASAGGHLSLLYSYKYNVNNKVKAVISMAGPTDLTSLASGGSQPQVLQWLIGSSVQVDPGAYTQASPISHVSAGSMPTLLFHGKKDLLVPYQQSVELSNRLNKFGVSNKLVLYEDAGHEVVSVNNVAIFLAECESWFKIHLK